MENELYGYAIPEIKEFIGKREEEYLDRFRRLKDGRKFNFPAAFFGGIWFGYRKMWLEGLFIMAYETLLYMVLYGVFGILLLNKMMSDIDNLSEILGWLVYTIRFISIGLMADKTYWRNIKKRLDFMHLPEKVRDKKLGFITVFKTCKGVSLYLGAGTMLPWRESFMRLTAAGIIIVTELILLFWG
jgi:hypothetical protein